MMFSIEELRRELPTLEAIKNEPDPVVICKFSYTNLRWNWYMAAFNGEETFYGLNDGYPLIGGYYSLADLVNTYDDYGEPLERDKHFKPCRLSRLLARRNR